MPRKPKAKGKSSLGSNLYLINSSIWFRFTYKGTRYDKRIGRADEIPPHGLLTVNYFPNNI